MILFVHILNPILNNDSPNMPLCNNAVQLYPKKIKKNRLFSKYKTKREHSTKRKGSATNMYTFAHMQKLVSLGHQDNEWGLLVGGTNQINESLNNWNLKPWRLIWCRILLAAFLLLCKWVLAVGLRMVLAEGLRSFAGFARLPRSTFYCKLLYLVIPTAQNV